MVVEIVLEAEAVGGGYPIEIGMEDRRNRVVDVNEVKRRRPNAPVVTQTREHPADERGFACPEFAMQTHERSRGPRWRESGAKFAHLQL
jgi:hypothetical protein